MTREHAAVTAHTGVTEAAAGRRTYSGTVSATTRTTSPVESYVSVSAAALSLGHRTYSGTVAATERMP